MRVSAKTFWDRARLFPPILCRLLAATRRRGTAVEKTTEQIARDSGLPIKRVEAISWHTDWDQVPFGEMCKFLRGCDIDFENASQMKLLTNYFRRGAKFGYLKRSENWPMYERMLEKLGQAYREEG